MGKAEGKEALWAKTSALLSLMLQAPPPDRLISVSQDLNIRSLMGLAPHRLTPQMHSVIGSLPRVAAAFLPPSSKQNCQSLLWREPQPRLQDADIWMSFRKQQPPRAMVLHRRVRGGSPHSGESLVAAGLACSGERPGMLLTPSSARDTPTWMHLLYTVNHATLEKLGLRCLRTGSLPRALLYLFWISSRAVSWYSTFSNAKE
ncbi:uncharacterized protein LOC125150516 isoform X2 [Prionailurus viverrinus]|uniref:uncharacterized protein LOC125150516 isoform X2 n=1 Tax=Prionailurus viverrinus TaxID=61388 RepID=UPI001FF34A59|nr:uncharacterized protein LOC125150516 isoform X2 [Prionailurus viverrinus]